MGVFGFTLATTQAKNHLSHINRVAFYEEDLPINIFALFTLITILYTRIQLNGD
ncbi:hypothetical protein SAMN02745866_00891 [Alteromonadaceae bacterium Bs31]|nr:hypothetical protein SAMN02745866_00891 [Alteromonadaceae bacterium Bs31]